MDKDLPNKKADLNSSASRGLSKDSIALSNNLKTPIANITPSKVASK